ncbi:MAG: tRNA dihydrouridine(20/20a) synthase DusA [Pseudomonadota bacterium]
MAGRTADSLTFARRLSVAPMMDWTDRHCRYLHRLMCANALLYTEMVTAAAVVHGDAERLLAFSPEEQPVALQLGGSEPALLAKAVRIAAPYGYPEINLNVGCPSDRVQSGAFGACLMREPELVADCAAAMIDASDGAEVTVKCRIGVDEQTPEDVLPDFIDKVAVVGVRHFAVHARMAWLDGLSPKENRDIPPLDYDLVKRQKRRRPDLNISINGGITSLTAAKAFLEEGLDGVMIGRAAYHDPSAILSPADEVIFGTRGGRSPDQAVEAMLPYIEARLSEGARLNQITRHMLTLFQGRPGARRWRRMLSEFAHKPGAGPEVVLRALAEVAPQDEAA